MKTRDLKFRALTSVITLTVFTILASSASSAADKGSPGWKPTQLYKFLGEADGAWPNEVALDPAGNLYGTAAFGGRAGCGQFGWGCGVAFKVNTKNHESVLYTFTGSPDGETSYAGLARDSSGALYGETSLGGTNNMGTLFKLTPSPKACVTALCPWNETVLHNFGSGADGGLPQGDLIRDEMGNFYGTAVTGGNYGFGTVFTSDPGGHESSLYSFCSQPNCTDGQYPYGALLLDQAGNLYGTANGGGASGAGIVFELMPTDSGWTEKILYNFTGGSDGGTPYAGLVADEEGNLYGTTSGGGGPACGGGCGVVFQLSPQSNETWKETVLHTFTGAPDGGASFAGLIRDGAGNLYGTTSIGGISSGCPLGIPGCGTVFELSPNSDGTWTETILWSFTGAADGSSPYGPVVMDAYGNLYGATFNGGDLDSTSPACVLNGSPIGCGVVFKLTPQ